MWDFGGHELVITGAGYDEYWGYHFTIRCFFCPKGFDEAPVWAAEEELDPLVDHTAALRAVRDHVRGERVISDARLEAAILLATMTQDLEAGLGLLVEP